MRQPSRVYAQRALQQLWGCSLRENTLVEITVSDIVTERSGHRFIFGASTGQTAAADGDELGIPILDNRLWVEAVARNLQVERVNRAVMPYRQRAMHNSGAQSCSSVQKELLTIESATALVAA